LKGLLLGFKEPSSKNKLKSERRKGRGAGGCGGICSSWEIFFLKSGAEVFSRPEKFRPWTLQNFKFCGQLQAHSTNLDFTVWQCRLQKLGEVELADR